MGESRDDVVVLGAGVIGLSCALALRKRGARVRVLERGAPGCGASHGNCGTITPSHSDPLFMPGMVGQSLRWMWRRDAPFFVSPKPDLQRLRWLLGFARRCNWRDFERVARARGELLRYSRQRLADWIAAEGLACEFVEGGTLCVYRSAAARAAHAWHGDLLQRLGMAVERLSGEAVAAMEPALRPGMAGGEWHPGDAQLRPDRLVAELARRLRELGGVIEQGVLVTSFERDGSRIRGVRANGATFRGEQVVLALGAWTPRLARQLRLHLPMQPGKGYSLTSNRPEQCPSRPLTLYEDSVCVTAWSDGFRLGSTMELSGYTSGLNRLRLEAIKRGAERYLRQPMGTRLQEEWWGWRPMCVDELPLIGPSSRWPNLYLATGHGMMGVSMATGTAELAAADLAGGPPPMDPTPYRPARFGV